MIVEPDFLDHWKTRLLVRLLNTETAPIYVLRLWAHCQARKTDRFTGWKPTVLASVCRWETDPQTLWDAMLETYLELDGDAVVARGWADVNASLISAWNNGKKGGRPSGKKPKGNRPVNPPVTDRLTDREDKIEKIEKKEHGSAVASLPPSPWTVAHGVELPETLRTTECLAAVMLWLKHKKEKGQSYKVTGLTAALKKWETEYGPSELPKAIERAMANNWAGVHPDNDKKVSPPTPPPGQEWRNDPTDWRHSL